MKSRLKVFFVIVLIFIAVSITLIGVIARNGNSDKSLSVEELPVTLDNVKIEIKDNTLTKRSATVIITNKSDSRIAFGEDYRIDKKENQKWTKMKTVNKNYITTTIINEIGRGEKIEKNIDWSKLYGTLKKGQFRLVKEIYGEKEIDGITIGEYIAVEFTIK